MDAGWCGTGGATGSADARRRPPCMSLDLHQQRAETLTSTAVSSPQTAPAALAARAVCTWSPAAGTPPCVLASLPSWSALLAARQEAADAAEAAAAAAQRAQAAAAAADAISSQLLQELWAMLSSSASSSSTVVAGASCPEPPSVFAAAQMQPRWRCASAVSSTPLPAPALLAPCASAPAAPGMAAQQHSNTTGGEALALLRQRSTDWLAMLPDLSPSAGLEELEGELAALPCLHAQLPCVAAASAATGPLQSWGSQPQHWQHRQHLQQQQQQLGEPLLPGSKRPRLSPSGSMVSVQVTTAGPGYGTAEQVAAAMPGRHGSTVSTDTGLQACSSLGALSGDFAALAGSAAAVAFGAASQRFSRTV